MYNGTPSSTTMLELRVHGPGGSNQRLPLQSRLTIGRSRENDLFLPDQWLSRFHAEIRLTPNGFLIVDLGSKNGTLLNGRTVQGEAAMHPGDIVVLGEHTLSIIEATQSGDVLDEEPEPAGTQIFSVKDLSSAATQPSDNIEELTRQNRVLMVLSRASKELLAHRPLPELFEQILNLLFEAVPAERGAILLLDEGSGELRIAASRSRHGQAITAISRSIARKSLEGGALLLPNVMDDSALQSQESILSLGIRSAVCVPLWLAGPATQKEKVIGLAYLDTLKDYHSFTEDDLRILTTLANVAAAKIENVRLLEETLEKRRLEEDLRVAAQIQRSLLPASPPAVPGYELVGSQTTSRTIGGDYYDFDADGKGRLMLALGDVSGKGTGAALLMTVLRAAVRGNWMDGEPAEAVASINRFVGQNVTPGKFVTFFLARLDPVRHTLDYTNAGHNPPMLLRKDGSIERLQAGGLVLGIVEAPTYEQGTVSLGPGETLVIYSDGMSESWSEDGQELGDDGLGQLAIASSHLSAQELEQELLRGIDAFSGGAKPTDDRTIIILKRLPA